MPTVVSIDALLASLEGRIVLRAQEKGDDPELVGVAAARRLLTDERTGRLIDDEGP